MNETRKEYFRRYYQENKPSKETSRLLYQIDRETILAAQRRRRAAKKALQPQKETTDEKLRQRLKNRIYYAKNKESILAKAKERKLASNYEPKPRGRPRTPDDELTVSQMQNRIYSEKRKQNEQKTN